MAALLISVRSADEARAAVAGGASIIDVKEPDRGPLGRADPEVWQAVRRAVPPDIPVSVALGELADWRSDSILSGGFEGIALRKIGLAGAGPNWTDAWARARLEGREGPPWVAVVYADWKQAKAPPPGEIVEAALAVPDCVGLLIDTWEKGIPGPLGPSWLPMLRRVRDGGRFVALAGGLVESDIVRLAHLEPDIFAVRGAACDRGDRRGIIDSARVAALVRAAGAARPQAGIVAAVGTSARRFT